MTSSVPHEADKQPQAGHGTATSYVTGFVLSLLFTAVPYYMVVNKTVEGTALLATILGFALVQLLVQIVFFLHLGRGPKPLYNIAFFVSTVGIILVVVLGSIFIMNHLYHNMAPSEVSKKLAEDEGIHQLSGKQTGACQGVHVNHKVVIKDSKVSPSYITAHHCDTLSFINQDDTMREITFGTHPRHASYGGEADMPVRKGRAKTIVLNQLGSYQFHDHPDPAANGYFTVLADDTTAPAQPDKDMR